MSVTRYLAGMFLALLVMMTGEARADTRVLVDLYPEWQVRKACRIMEREGDLPPWWVDVCGDPIPPVSPNLPPVSEDDGEEPPLPPSGCWTTPSGQRLCPGEDGRGLTFSEFAELLGGLGVFSTEDGADDPTPTLDDPSEREGSCTVLDEVEGPADVCEVASTACDLWVGDCTLYDCSGSEPTWVCCQDVAAQTNPQNGVPNGDGDILTCREYADADVLVTPSTEAPMDFDWTLAVEDIAEWWKGWRTGLIEHNPLGTDYRSGPTIEVPPLVLYEPVQPPTPEPTPEGTPTAAPVEPTPAVCGPGETPTVFGLCLGWWVPGGDWRWGLLAEPDLKEACVVEVIDQPVSVENPDGSSAAYLGGCEVETCPGEDPVTTCCTGESLTGHVVCQTVDPAAELYPYEPPSTIWEALEWLLTLPGSGEIPAGYEGPWKFYLYTSATEGR